jgi:hypothetical protein
LYLKEFSLNANFQLKQRELMEKMKQHPHINTTAHGLTGTEYIKNNGKKVYPNQNKEKIQAGNNQVPTHFFITNPFTRINMLNSNAIHL